MTSLDIETIEHLDFEFAPPCESEDIEGLCNGNNAAEWRVVVSCHGEIKLYCDDCLNAKIHDMDLYCPLCDRIFKPSSTAYTLIERLT